MERSHNLCFFHLRTNYGSLTVYGTSSPAWKRGPLAPVVVVGEGQVNLGFRPAVVAMAKVSKALWLINEFRSSPVAIPVATVTVVASGVA